MQSKESRIDWPLVDWSLRKPAVDRRERLLPDEYRMAFEASGEMTLLSLDPDQSRQGPETFHGYDALGDSLEEPGAALAKCFHPHHGVRAVLNGLTVEWVICFECFQVNLYCDGTKSRCGIAEGGRSYLNRLLRWSTVPMAPQFINGQWR